MTGQTQPLERFRPQDFLFNDDNTALCPAGKQLRSPGSIHATASGLCCQTYTAKAVDCQACALSGQCRKGPLKLKDGRGR